LIWKTPNPKVWGISYVVLSVLCDMVYGHLSILRDIVIVGAIGLILGVVKEITD
jgi:hypothetical protein